MRGNPYLGPSRAARRRKQVRRRIPRGQAASRACSASVAFGNPAGFRPDLNDAREVPRSDHERAPRLEPHRGALEKLGVLALLRLQLAVEAPLGRGLGELATGLQEEPARPLLEVDGEAQQLEALGVPGGLAAREDG